jgi:hypothetical protein
MFQPENPGCERVVRDNIERRDAAREFAIGYGVLLRRSSTEE